MNVVTKQSRKGKQNEAPKHKIMKDEVKSKKSMKHVPVTRSRK
jgi:hypothetical protein